MTTKNNNIKGESSIALSEQLIPIIFQETSISSRRHPHSAKDFKEKKIKQKIKENPFDIRTTVHIIPGYANGYRDSLFAFLLTLPVNKNQKCFGY